MGIAATAAVGAAMAARPRAAAAAPPTALDVDPGALLYKLVQRITWGASESELAAAAALGYQGYLEQQLSPETITEDPALEASLATLTTLTMTPQQLYTQAGMNSSLITNELIEAKVRRAVSSRRQLLERMVDFWSDHFSIDLFDNDGTVLKPVDDREVVRPNALGTFGALVNASARSPAMLNYLNNDISTRTNPNENYGRELLELHTLSPAAGYTQSDVREVARCFTGWTKYANSAANGALSGTFRYVHTNHDTAQKTLSPVFDIAGGFQNPVVIPANQGPMVDAQQVIDIIARHPATATYVATKLCRRLLGEDVRPETISAVATTFLTTGGDVRAMLRVIFRANVLADATPRFKRPFHLTVSAMRALPTTLTSTSSLRTQYTRLGHVPFAWSPPDGYPDTVAYWAGNELPRWNFGASASTGGISGVAMNLTATGGLLAGLTTRAQIVDRINRALFNGEMGAADRDRVTAFLPATGTITDTQKKDTVGLALGCPSFQYY